MNQLSYGWIGNKNSIRLRKRTDITQLSNIIKKALKGYAKFEEEDIRAKNVIKYNGKVIYILSVKGSMWAPYPFLRKLMERDDFILLLARDKATKEDDISGEFWILKVDRLRELIWDGKEITLTFHQGMDSGYYSFPGSLLSETEKVSFENAEELQELMRDKVNGEL